MVPPFSAKIFRLKSRKQFVSGLFAFLCILLNTLYSYFSRIFDALKSRLDRFIHDLVMVSASKSFWLQRLYAEFL